MSEIHKLALNPNHLTFTVAGDISLNEIVKLLESKFGKWKAESDTELKNLPTVALPEKRKVYLINKPNAEQSYIVAGQLLPPSATPEEFKIDYMNYAIGGSFTSRLNMNLREDKQDV